MPRIVGVAAWRRTDSEFAKVWWDILPAYYETVTASQLLEHICTHAQASGVKELISAQMFAENSPQAKDLIAAGFVPSRCNEQFVVPFTIGMERTSRIAEKWKQRSRIKSHNSFFVRPFVAADAQSVWQFPGIAPLFFSVDVSTSHAFQLIWRNFASCCEAR
ncbi:MAG: hypothetical protein LR015_13085 [Verrucomicrobia bacterium]|nr:hypothetical protein [Verrucomicrobiota bacterium]